MKSLNFNFPKPILSLLVAIGTLVLSLLPARGLGQSNEKDIAEIRSNYETLKILTQTKYGKDAANYISDNSFDYFGSLNDKVKGADSTQIVRHNYFDKFLILGMRHCLPKDSLMKLSTGKDFFISAVNIGLLEIGEESELNFDDAVISNDYAKVHPSAYGMSLPTVYYEFRKENGRWKLDYSSLLPSVNMSLQMLTKMAGLNETENILSSLEEISGSKPTNEIWKPLDTSSKTLEIVFLLAWSLIYIIIIIATYKTAKRKNRNTVGWIIAAIFFHLFALLAILILKPKSLLELHGGYDSVAYTDPKLKGIKGWLLIFLVLIIVVHPSFLIWRWTNLLDAKSQSYSQMYNNPTPMAIQIAAAYAQHFYVSTVVTVVILLVSIITTLLVVKKKHYAPRWAKIYVVIFTACMIVVFFMDSGVKYQILQVQSFLLPPDPTESGKIFGTFFLQIILSLTLLILWLRYFKKSVRVRQTFQKAQEVAIQQKIEN
jgi:hypothetical protein